MAHGGTLKEGEAVTRHSLLLQDSLADLQTSDYTDLQTSDLLDS